MARPAHRLIVLGVLVIMAALLHVSPGGEAHVSFGQLLGAIFRPNPDDFVTSIVWDLRLPRLVLCLLVGALLGTVGSVYQALLRNPLADPYVLGVSSGAAVGGAVAVIFGWTSLAVAGTGFLGGMLALTGVYAVSTRRGAVDGQTLILAGVVLGALLSSVLTVVLLAGGQDQRVVLGWLLGETSQAEPWKRVVVLSGALAVGFPILYRQSRQLNALALGGETAQRLGVDTRRLSRLVLGLGGLMTAAAVGAVGIIGFLGLVAPHLSRRWLGVDWRWSLPGATLLGALLLVVSDLIAQRGLPTLLHRPGMELPVGAVTSILGAPTLLWILRKKG